MIRNAFCHMVGWIYLVFTLPALYRVNYLERLKRDIEKEELIFKATAKYARFLFRLTGSTIKITGTELIPENQAVLFASNHQSHADSLIIHGFINKPKGFISIVEVLPIPILSAWMKKMKCVFLDRGDTRQSLACIEEAAKILREGHSMVIYPEGKLTDGTHVAEFKKGSLKLAIKAGVPIVPITLKRSNFIMKNDGSGIRAVDVECIVSSPVSTSGLRKGEEARLAEEIRGIMIKNLS